jgi:hypothetical protein
VAKKKKVAGVSDIPALRKFYDEHRGGSGKVVLVEAEVSDGRMIGAFSSVDEADQWVAALKRERADVGSVCLFPLVIDVPEHRYQLAN